MQLHGDYNKTEATYFFDIVFVIGLQIKRLQAGVINFPLLFWARRVALAPLTVSFKMARGWLLRV